VNRKVADDLLARLEELLPAVVELAARHACRIVGKAGRTPHIGHRIGPLRVEVGLVERLLHILEIRHASGIDLEQQPVADHLLDGRAGRHDDVVAAAARLELRQHRLVGVVRVQGDLDAGLRLEALQEIGRHVVRPVEEVQLLRLGGGRQRRQRRRQRRDGGGENDAFHGGPPFLQAGGQRKRRPMT
jgi:hypothetical protein